MQVELDVCVPSPLNAYSLLVCECDFCAENDVALLSANDGLLTLSSTISLARTQLNGDESSLVSCPHCEQVIVCSLENDRGLFGAVNVECLDLHDTQALSKTKPVNTHCLSRLARNQQANARIETQWMRLHICEPD